MSRFFIVLSLFLLVFSSCSHTYYIVRHAEKEAQATNMSSDVSLTNQGKQRAEALKEILKNKKIAYIFSTNTIRTQSTAQPTADYFHLAIETYGPRPDSAFISLLKSKKKNVLVVGHSNTVDDIVNMLCNEKRIATDLNDDEYDNLFVVKYKGGKIFFSNKKIQLPR
ncbi:MAG: phosphoglycerate mutase family protein [Bacteroidota bacterium]|nr:phosphoglycerate mutase family protein [Bacteroidota bacterium]